MGETAKRRTTQGQLGVMLTQGLHVWTSSEVSGSARQDMLGATRLAPHLLATAPSAPQASAQETTSKGRGLHLFGTCQQFFVAGDLQRQWVFSSWWQLPNLVGAVWIGRLRLLIWVGKLRWQQFGRQHCQLSVWTEL